MRNLFILLIMTLLFIENTNAQGEGHVFNLNIDSLRILLDQSKEKSLDSDIEDIVIHIPNHVGKSQRYFVYKSSVMSKEMEAKYPDFMTYSVQGVDNKLAYGRIFISRFGLRGTLHIGTYRVVIEPSDPMAPLAHKAYLYEDNEPFECKTSGEAKILRGQFSGARSPNGATLRNYEMAITTTGEFYQNANFGNSNMAQANAAITNIVNNVNVYWNAEMSILISIYQDPIIFTNPSTDPFNPGGSSILGQTSAAIHAVYPSGEYDLGHCLHARSSGGSGIAYIGVVCNNNFIPNFGRYKAGGFSSGSNQNLLSVGIMVHEIGHLFNADHTFNGSLNNCGVSQHSINSAYEIGSGTTIMSYAGICGDHNVQSSPDLYFHSKSLESFHNYVTSTLGDCSTNSSTGNTPPTVDATSCTGPYIIPIMTPFELIGSGMDADDDPLIYNWEQIDEDGATVRPTHGFIGSTASSSALAPLFRSVLPSSLGYKRTFPSIQNVINNVYLSNFEPLPNVSRSLNFRLTARDMVTPHAAYSYDDITITVDATKGPLTVTSPNTAITISAGNNHTVTWTVNNTQTICNSVNILLSIDGGWTYPITLLSNTPNDGSQAVLFPTNLPNTTTARVKIESACLTCLKFFDISNVNFTINSSCNVAFSGICDISPISANQGDAILDLDPTIYFGTIFNSLTLTASGPNVLSSLHTGSSPQTGGCTSINYQDRSAAQKFIPSISGVYTLTVSGGFQHISIYQNEYIAASPCTNFLTSTAFNNGNIFSTINVDLEACQIYEVVFFDQNNVTGTITISPPPGGSVYLHNPPSSLDYSYTYMAVRNSDQVVSSVSSTADFTSLAGGEYCVYGLHYYSGSAQPPGNVNPNNYIGQTLDDVLSAGDCVLQSENCKPVDVISTCSTVVTNGNDSGPGSLRAAIQCNPPGTTITFDPSVSQLTLLSSIVIDKDLTLQGISSAQRPELILSTHGMTINVNTTLVLNNVDIKYTGANTINGAGTLSVLGVTDVGQ